MPTAAQWDALRSLTTSDDYAPLSAADAAAKANADPSVATAPAPVYESELMGLLAPQEFAALFNHIRFSDIKADIDRQNVVGLRVWVGGMHALSMISDATAGALLAYLGRTVPASTRAVEVFGQPISANDVDAARGTN